MIWFAVCFSFGGKAQQTFRVLSYNVENFFDCRHDSLKNDSEYLPGGLRGWSPGRYYDKRNKIAKVILAAADGQVPDAVALCEVENSECVEGLVRFSPLRDAAYRYVITDSPDERGIDVALLYQPASFRLVGKRCIRIPKPPGDHRPTRDLLHVAGRVVTGDTLDFLVCHCPSRAGGRRKTETYRLKVAETIRSVADSLAAVRENLYLIILGDFNDEPESEALCRLTAARPGKSVPSAELHNLMLGRSDGTYRYRGEWNLLDQFIVSEKFLQPDANLRTSPGQVSVLMFPFLLEPDAEHGGKMPYRTYRGMKYNGGFSDHLPICLDLLRGE